MNADLDTGQAVFADRMRQVHRRVRRQLAARARGFADWCLYTRLGDILVDARFRLVAGRARREALHADAERSPHMWREQFGPLIAADRNGWAPDPVAAERVRQRIMALPTTPPQQSIRARARRLLARAGSVAAGRSHD